MADTKMSIEEMKAQVEQLNKSIAEADAKARVAATKLLVKECSKAMEVVESSGASRESLTALLDASARLYRHVVPQSEQHSSKQRVVNGTSRPSGRKSNTEVFCNEINTPASRAGWLRVGLNPDMPAIFVGDEQVNGVWRMRLSQHGNEGCVPNAYATGKQSE